MDIERGSDEDYERVSAMFQGCLMGGLVLR